MLQLNTDERLNAADAAQREGDEYHGHGCDRFDPDALCSRANSQAGALTPHVPLSAALSLLNKQHLASPCYSPRANNNSGRASDQQLLRPIVARFLESLPSFGKAWSFDTEGLHSVQDINDDACSDSISCCSCSSLQLQLQHPRQRPASAASMRQRPRSLVSNATGHPATASRHAHGAAAPHPSADANETLSSSRAALAQTASGEGWGSFELQQQGSAAGHAAPRTPRACSSPGRLWCPGSAVRSLSFHTAESTGSAPTPSPTAAAQVRSSGGAAAAGQTAGQHAAAGADVASAGSGRRGVFVGNLPGDVGERALVELFSRCGRIDSLWIARNAASQASLGYGFVVFDAGSGQQATERAERELNGLLLQQQRICVRVSTRSF